MEIETTNAESEQPKATLVFPSAPREPLYDPDQTFINKGQTLAATAAGTVLSVVLGLAFLDAVGDRFLGPGLAAQVQAANQASLSVMAPR